MTPNVHLSPLALDAAGATPWDFSPIWFALLAMVLPAILWTALAWKRALEEDPYRLRRAGRRELRKLLTRLQRGGGTPRPADLYAWFQAAARTWGVRVSTPTEVELKLSELDGDAATQARWRELWKKRRAPLIRGGFNAVTQLGAGNHCRREPGQHSLAQTLVAQTSETLVAFGGSRGVCVCAPRGSVQRAACR